MRKLQTAAELNEAVTLGVALLDQRKPGWASIMDLEDFDIRNSQSCPLGQSYGDYNDGLLELLGLEDAVSHGSRVDFAIAHGFLWYNPDDDADDFDSQYYGYPSIREYYRAMDVVKETLNSLWKVVIGTRQLEGSHE